MTMFIARRSAGLSNGLLGGVDPQAVDAEVRREPELVVRRVLVDDRRSCTFGMKTKLHSDAPLASAVVCALLSLYDVYRSSLTFGRSCQYAVAARVSVVVCGVNDFSVYGPVPIGFLQRVLVSGP